MTQPVLLLAAAAALSVGLSTIAYAGPKDTIATVGTARVTREELELYMPKGRERTPELERAVLDSIVREFALSQAATRQGIYGRPEVKLELERQRRRLAIGILSREFLAEHPVSEERLKEFYEEQRNAYGRHEYRLRHILVDDEATAADLTDRIKKGADFAEVAKGHSKDKNRDAGGLFDWTTLAIFPEPFAVAVQSLDPGQVRSRPLRTQFGWHVIKLEGVRPAELFPSYEESKDRLRKELENRALVPYWESIVAATPVEVVALPSEERKGAKKSRD